MTDQTEEQRHVISVEETETSIIVEFQKEEAIEEPAEEIEEVQDVVEEIVEEIEEEAREIAPGKVVYRTIDLSRGSIDEEKRIVRIGVSSETPVERDFGLEVLSHRKEDIDMAFMASGREQS